MFLLGVLKIVKRYINISRHADGAHLKIQNDISFPFSAKHFIACNQKLKNG